ncbi:HD-GYP domain-containing protein [Halanaerobium polyolivorans]|nr:HD domain-containing phosphohydrolase [Halanaerobium polyolivorans]
MYQNKLSESKSSKNKIVKSLLNSLSAKSNETREHAERMNKLAVRFGSKLKLTYAEINRLSLLASMHDIGKTTISEEILTKAGKLNNEEWEIMKNHSKQGYKIASASEEFILIAEDILGHHEHWDGSGYPGGLKAKEIPFLARIISIIDAYDVMTHERPYSKAISKDKALAEIKDCAGSQFDPELAEDFIDMMNKPF